MTAKKVSELTALAVPAGEDLLLIVDDPSVDPASKKITVTNLFLNTTSNNVTSNNISVTSQFTVGGASTNASLTSTAFRLGNTTVNTAITATAIRIGNSTVNTVISANSLTVGGETFISLEDLKTVVAASSDFDNFKTRIAAL